MWHFLCWLFKRTCPKLCESVVRYIFLADLILRLYCYYSLNLLLEWLYSWIFIPITSTFSDYYFWQTENNVWILDFICGSITNLNFITIDLLLASLFYSICCFPPASHISRELYILNVFISHRLLSDSSFLFSRALAKSWYYLYNTTRFLFLWLPYWREYLN